MIDPKVYAGTVEFTGLDALNSSYARNVLGEPLVAEFERAREYMAGRQTHVLFPCFPLDLSCDNCIDDIVRGAVRALEEIEYDASGCTHCGRKDPDLDPHRYDY